MKNRNYLSEEIAWKATNNPEYPYRAFHEGVRLLIRLNEFPAEHLYTLIADDEETVNFDDWASTWIRNLEASEKGAVRGASATRPPMKRTRLRNFGKAKIRGVSATKD
ncbi:MAG: hypothetical protein ACR2HG_06825 [Pyrinomonadaceae bacterium]